MKYIPNFLFSAILILTSVGLAAAQTENDLKNFFEGRHVEIKLDMPATKDGVNVYPERERAVNYANYSNLLKANGAGVLEGDRILVTKIKVKGKNIEFQLGGGGYGTFGDETGSISVPTASKTQRERDLERRLKDEQDDYRRRRMREELSYLREERAREDNRNRAEAAAAEEIAKARIQEKRLQAGSRFNIRFDRKITPRDLTPEAVMSALAEYVDFYELP